MAGAYGQDQAVTKAHVAMVVAAVMVTTPATAWILQREAGLRSDALQIEADLRAEIAALAVEVRLLRGLVCEDPDKANRFPCKGNGK